MNVGTGEPGRQMAKFANGRAASTYELSETISPIADVSPNADPPAHAKRILMTSQTVIATGGFTCSAYIVIPSDLNLTIVCRRTDVFYFANAIANPLSLALNRAYVAPAALPSSLGLFFPVDGNQELMGGSAAYGQIPIRFGSQPAAAIGGATLWQVPVIRSANAVAMECFSQTFDRPIVLPSSRRIQQDLVFGWSTNAIAAAGDFLTVCFYLDHYQRWFDPVP